MKHVALLCSCSSKACVECMEVEQLVYKASYSMLYTHTSLASEMGVGAPDCTPHHLEASDLCLVRANCGVALP